MKKVKKLLAAMLAMAMILAMGVTTFAATVTITDKNGDSEFSAYKLFSATVDEGADPAETDDKVAYSVNEKYKSILSEVTGKASNGDMVAYIATLTKAEDTRAFADAVYAKISSASLTADATTNSQKFTDLDSGYYLIVETTPGNNGTYSLVMLDTAKNTDTTITTKESVPTLVKKVFEETNIIENGDGWQDAADYDIGDNVPFKLTGTVSNEYADYETYYYAFHDTLSSGLSLNENSIKVTVINAGKDDVVLTKDTDYTIKIDGGKFEVCFANLKEISAVSATSKITVEYTAVLNDKAVIGSTGNPNTAKLEYCNDPYYTGTGDGSGDEGDDGEKPDDPEDPEDENPTSFTPEDKVIVFTYELDVNKVDGNDDPLAGAGFTLYKGKDIVKKIQAADNTTEFKFKGLDAGTYKLVETEVPAGYNKADDIEFTITADYDKESDDPKLTKLEVPAFQFLFELIEGAVTDGIVSATVVNVSGTFLPSTGGIGTTIFYVVGVLFMIAAVILYIKGKRVEMK